MPMGLPTGCGVTHPDIIKQDCQEWCWAASASMIFAMHGHPVAQERIVMAAYGRLVCASANTTTILRVLNSNWQDDNGVRFQPVVTAAYDVMNRVNRINNTIIAGELAANRPMLYCNTHHAMVVTDMEFFDTPYGPDVRRVDVLDPWPYSQDMHPLSPPEMAPAHMGGQMTFLAAVQVTSAP